MRAFRDLRQDNSHNDFWTFAMGAMGGLAVGVLIHRSGILDSELGREFRNRADEAVRRLRPARLQRLSGDIQRIERLEDDVIEAFREDSILSERGIDIGGISPGIIELSGSVMSADESLRAMDVANGVPGVRTVVNRMAIEQPYRKSPLRKTLDEENFGETFGHSESRVGGMGRRRQSDETDPARPDESQHSRQSALAAADRDQWSREGFAHTNSRMDATPEIQAPNRTHFSEDQLDNQDPANTRDRED